MNAGQKTRHLKANYEGQKMNDLPRDLFEKVLSYYDSRSPSAKIVQPYLDEIEMMEESTWGADNVKERLARKGFLDTMYPVHRMYDEWLEKAGYTAKVLKRFAKVYGGWSDPRLPFGRLVFAQSVP